jgi:hypothetical protein
MRSILRSRIAAWIVLAAMLVSAVSPALAASIFSGRADVLQRMLALPAAPGITQDHRHAGQMALGHDDAHSGAHDGSGAGDDSEHAAHGVLCSFCLTAGSVLCLPGAARAHWSALPREFARMPAESLTAPTAHLLAAHHPRDPPVFLI